MHVLLVPSSYPDTSNPLRCVFFREQALALQKAGHRVGVVAASVTSLNQIRFRGIPERTVRFENDNSIATYRCTEFALTHRLKQSAWPSYRRAGSKLLETYLMEQGSPDIIHAHCALMGGAIATHCQQILGIPVILTEHFSTFGRQVLRPWELNLAKNTYARVMQRIVVSPSLGNLLGDLFPLEFKNWSYIPNLVSAGFSDWVLPRKRDDDIKFRFLNVASLNSNKDHATLLRAFAVLQSKLPHVELVIGGEGREKNALINLARELRILKSVFFLGSLDRDAVIREMWDADAFVLSSQYETFGVVLVEALASGKPVVATACGGPECIVNENNGLLVPPKSVDKLAAAMETLVIEISRYDAFSIREDCLSRFGELAVTSMLSDVYATSIKASTRRNSS